MAQFTCSISGCDGRLHQARGLCRMHYARWQRHGDPLANRHPIHRPLAERFHERYVKTDGGCWLWKPPLARKGYGYLNVNRVPQWAHRISYELLVGPIPKGLQIDHLCMVKSCVNPAHLEVVTPAENMRRMRVAKASAVSRSW